MSINANQIKHYTPKRPINQTFNSPSNTYQSPSRTHNNPQLAARWRRGPDALTDNSTERLKSESNPLRIPSNADSNVKSGTLQCFFCGRFGHTYRNKGCAHFESNGDRTGAHWRDWRRVVKGLYYSIDVLFPEQYANSQRRQQARPNNKSIKVTEDVNNNKPHISALDWSSEGFGVPDDDNEVPAEYLFDGGATDAVSNDRSLLINYLPLPFPIPIHTATNDSNAFIVGKGQLEVAAEEGGMTIIDDVYYCPKATSTIISPGALINKGARMTMNDKNDFCIVLSDGKTIYAKHKNRRWFIKSRSGHNKACRHVCQKV